MVLEFKIESKKRTKFREFQECLQSSEFIKRRGYAIKIVVLKVTDGIHSRGQAYETHEKK